MLNPKARDLAYSKPVPTVPSPHAERSPSGGFVQTALSECGRMLPRDSRTHYDKYPSGVGEWIKPNVIAKRRTKRSHRNDDRRYARSIFPICQRLSRDVRGSEDSYCRTPPDALQ